MVGGGGGGGGGEGRGREEGGVGGSGREKRTGMSLVGSNLLISRYCAQVLLNRDALFVTGHGCF